MFMTKHIILMNYTVLWPTCIYHFSLKKKHYTLPGLDITLTLLVVINLSCK